ncbi:peptide ABC transporter substrate-binding protein, partial [Streptomyces sp. NPDC041003]
MNDRPTGPARRTVLIAGSAATLALAAGCGTGSGTATDAKNTADATPRPGGRLRAAFAGGGP